MEGSRDKKRVGKAAGLWVEWGWRLTFGWGGVEDSGSWKSSNSNQSIALLLHPDPKGVRGVSWDVRCDRKGFEECHSTAETLGAHVSEMVKGTQQSAMEW